MQITIPKDAEADLRAKAKASGFDSIDEYVFSRLNIGEEPSSDVPASYSEWRRELEEYLQTLKPGHAHFDDSRESIYPDR